MSFNPSVKALLAAAVVGGAALVATAPARAGDFDDDFGPSYHRPRVERQVTITTVTRRYGYDAPAYGRGAFYDEDDAAPYRRRYLERRHAAQPVFYGRPVYERPPYARPVYGRPVYGRPVYGGFPECRTVVTKRVNAWGDVVTKRVKSCG